MTSTESVILLIKRPFLFIIIYYSNNCCYTVKQSQKYQMTLSQTKLIQMLNDLKEVTYFEEQTYTSEDEQCIRSNIQNHFYDE